MDLPALASALASADGAKRLSLLGGAQAAVRSAAPEALAAHAEAIVVLHAAASADVRKLVVGVVE